MAKIKIYICIGADTKEELDKYIKEAYDKNINVKEDDGVNLKNNICFTTNKNEAIAYREANEFKKWKYSHVLEVEIDSSKINYDELLELDSEYRRLDFIIKSDYYNANTYSQWVKAHNRAIEKYVKLENKKGVTNDNIFNIQDKGAIFDVPTVKDTVKSSNYWNKRAIERMTTAEKQSEAYIKSIKEMYNQTFKNINEEIAMIYKNYSKETGLDVEKLKELLTAKETSKTWKNLKRQGLDKYIKENYKSRISRLEQIQAQIYAKAKQIYTKEELQNTICYKGVINNSYYKAIYDTQIGTGYDFSFNKIDNNLLNTLLNEKWSGKNYSERIWGNTDILANSVSKIVGGALLSGQGIEKTTKQIKDRFNVSKYYAERLVRTETNHFNNEADARAYEEMGAKEYVFVAVLDSRTSEICQVNDNKKYLYKDRKVGVNYPPLHPNCRSTTRGYLGEEAEKQLKRRARNPLTGKSELIDNMSYKEWINKNNITKNNELNKSLKITSKNDIITPSNLLDKLNIDIKDYKAFGKYDPFNNDIQEKTSKLLKMNNKPRVLKQNEFENAEGIDVVRVVHEYHGKTAQEVYDNTLYGNIQYSEHYNSSFGRGIYFGDKSVVDSVISTYSQGDSKIINAKINKDANILEFNDQMEFIKAITNELKNIPKELQSLYQNEKSLLFMIKGIDGIKIKSNGYYCIYNRGVLIINE